MGKWANAFSASDKGEGKDVSAAKGDKAAAANATIALIKGIKIIPFE